MFETGFSHVLQGAVIKQDSILEQLLQPQESPPPAAGGGWRPLWRDGVTREAGAGSSVGELTLLQRQHSLLQEELLRLRDAEGRFKESEKARARLERQVRNMKDSQVRTFLLNYIKLGESQETDKSKSKSKYQNQVRFTYKLFAQEDWFITTKYKTEIKANARNLKNNYQIKYKTNMNSIGARQL